MSLPSIEPGEPPVRRRAPQRAPTLPPQPIVSQAARGQLLVPIAPPPKAAPLRRPELAAPPAPAHHPQVPAPVVEADLGAPAPPPIDPPSPAAMASLPGGFGDTTGWFLQSHELPPGVDFSEPEPAPRATLADRLQAMLGGMSGWLGRSGPGDPR